MTQKYDIKDIDLAEKGKRRIDWAFTEMPVLRLLLERFSRDKPLAGLRIGACLHVTTETANLLRVLQAGGADIALCASNPLSTQDDVAAALVSQYQIPVFAICGEDNDSYYRHIQAVIKHRPQLTMDDGADLVSELHTSAGDLLPEILGGTEETTTGVIRLRAMAKEQALAYPVIAVNDAMTKHLFDNRYGTGQSTLDGIIRATNILLAGKTFCVVGYGWCGRGIALRARGHGAHVIVTEVEPLRALEAVMDGYQVMPLLEAAAIADFIITATGDKHVVDDEHLQVLKNGCVLANSGHFNVEINIPALIALSKEKTRPREHVEEYVFKNGRHIRLLAEGRLVNLAAAEGHPATVMDMSFANQALALSCLAQQQQRWEPIVHTMPADLDAEVARLKLAAMDVRIDSLTDEQHQYLTSWQQGT